MKKAAVIGAGIGGLSAAIYAAGRGYAVDVYEKNSSPGGKAGCLEQSGFRFDTGPSLLTLPFVIKQLFTEAGADSENYLQIEKLEVLCKYFFADGTILNASADNAVFAAEIEAVTGTDRSAVKKYLQYCRQIYTLTSGLFLFGNFQSLKTLLSAQALKALLHLGQIDVFRTMHQANSAFFTDKRLVQMFDRYATYNGSSPYLAPATLNIIQHVEYNLGGYVVKGGMRELPRALAQLAVKKGVQFHYQSPVEQLALHGKTVTGICLKGKTLTYDSVIANADVYSVYKKLLPPENPSSEASRYASLEPSSSAMVFYWGVKGTFPELEIHNILFSENYEREFEDIFVQKKCPDDATVYVYISQKFAENDAPAGYTNWFVMINTPYNCGQDWDAAVTRCRKNIQERINKALHVHIAELIVSESVLTPPLLEERTGSAFGSIYGISSNNRNAAFLRQKNAAKTYKNLFFCGGSSHPGGGVPLVILSGKNAANSLDPIH